MYFGRKSLHKWTLRRTKLPLWLFLFTAILVLFTIYYEIPQFLNQTLSFADESKNYFLEEDKYSNMGYIVSTSVCKIPNIAVHDSSIMSFVDAQEQRPVECRKRIKELTYVDGLNVIINVTSLAKMSHNLKTISCCYKTITRVEQSPGNYNPEADNQFKYSDNCYPMKEITQPKEPFIQVICKKINSLVSLSLYENFHAVALPTGNSNIQRKLNYWHQSANTKSTKASKMDNDRNRPPNVIMVGIDSTSRLNFRRNMLQTKAFLEKLGAVEMQGYTKVGENTFPNFVPIMTSYTEEELQKLCYFTRDTLQDGCPYLWKRYSAANYLTAHIEDSPRLAIFNYLKTGFVKSPTDFYFRAFMMAIHKSRGGFPYSIECIGYQSVDEIILNYIGDLLQFSQTANVPIFLTSWLTSLSHEDMNAIRYGDPIYLNFLRNLNSKGLLNNTVLFFMSDHGYRFGQKRETFSGWYEDKLPNMWIRVSPDLQHKYPHWKKSLKINSKRLTSPFDVHKTFTHILEAVTAVSQVEHINTKQEDIKNLVFEHQAFTRRKLGQSLFTEVPYNRTCENAGVPDNYCACVPPIKLPSNDSYILKAAKTAVNHINSLIPRQCVHLTLSQIRAGAVMNKSYAINTDTDKDDVIVNQSLYIVAFMTHPGSFIFEAYVNSFPNQQYFNVTTEIQRMNRINTDTSCISDPILEVFCYCS